MNISVKNIKTNRLHIRRLEHTDVESIYEIFSNSEVTRYWGLPQMTDLSQANEFISETHIGFQNGNLLEWGIMETNTQRLIGVCAYSSFDKMNKQAEIGFALHEDMWGKGFMKELLSAFIPFGFNELSLHRIEADVDTRNQASISLLEQFGFKREGYLRERYHLNGEYQDAIIYALLAREFNESIL